MNLSDLFSMALLMVKELILDFPHISALIVIGALIPWGFALIRKISPYDWKRVWKPAFIFSLLSGIIAFFALPQFFHSGLSHLNYATDWLFHIASVISIMVYAWLIAVPALLLWCRKCRV